MGPDQTLQGDSRRKEVTDPADVGGDTLKHYPAPRGAPRAGLVWYWLVGTCRTGVSSTGRPHPAGHCLNNPYLFVPKSQGPSG